MKSLSLIAASLLCTTAFAGPPTSSLTPSNNKNSSEVGYGTRTGSTASGNINSNLVESLPTPDEAFTGNCGAGQGNYSGWYGGSPGVCDYGPNPVGEFLPFS